MKKFKFSYVELPKDLIYLLKLNSSMPQFNSLVLETIQRNGALSLVLESAFREFNDSKRLDKVMMALGWENFRDRLTSLYLHKLIHQHYPLASNLDLVTEIKKFEVNFRDFGVHGSSRLFLLGLYFKFSQFQQTIDQLEGIKFELLSDALRRILSLSQGHSEKVDWLVLTVLHLLHSLGEEKMLQEVHNAKTFSQLHDLLDISDRKWMLDNLLVYGACINESDFFIYDKI